MVYQDERQKQQNRNKVFSWIRWGNTWAGGCGGPTLPPVCCAALRPGSRGCDERAQTWGVSGLSSSLRYFFGAGFSCGFSSVAVCWADFGIAGLRLPGTGGLFLLKASPAGLVQAHVTQHSPGQACVRETGPLSKQWLGNIRHEAWNGERNKYLR